MPKTETKTERIRTNSVEIVSFETERSFSKTERKMKSFRGDTNLTIANDK